jgi:hypothetical protein
VSAADTVGELHALRERIAAAARERVRAEHARDAAAARALQARAALLDGWGVSTVDDARRVLAELNGRLAAEMADLTAELDKIGA